MPGKIRRLPDRINAGAMADIAFLLLIFFLVATTIAKEQGILVKLPPYDPDRSAVLTNSRNVLSVKINKNNQLMVEGLPIELTDLREQTKIFIRNPYQREDRPQNPRKAIISLQSDRSTTYARYLEVYNELRAAYRELWDQQARRVYQKNYRELEKGQQLQIRNRIPLVISEAEPTHYDFSTSR